jgi:hypothetical protein
VICSSCGRQQFVLPLSRLPAIDDGRQASAAAGAAGSPQARWWLPITAAGLTLIIVVFLFNVLLSDLFRRNPGPRPEGPDGVAKHLSAGKQALGQGKFRLAARELESAETLRFRYPETLNAGERRQLTQLQKQAALLGDLLPESLDEILRHAADMSELDEREWQEQFAARYQGKAVVFDDEVRQDGSAYRLLGYSFFVRGRPARVALEDLKLLRPLPLQRSQRLLFGARLASVRPEAGGVWVVHFVPDSGVLLTDADAVHAAYPIPADELREVLERQREWAAQGP